MRICIVISIIIVFTSCRKDCTLVNISIVGGDTISPHQYFPAYPGSWWQYSDNSILEIEPNWFEYTTTESGPTNADGCPSIIKNRDFVPKMEGYLIYGDTIVSYDDYHNKTGEYEVKLFPTISDGSLFSEGYGRSWRTFYESKDSLITQSGIYYDILAFTEHRETYGSDHQWHDVSWDTIYYAKDVGIVKQITTKWYLNTPSETKELTSYFINN
ncbi:MAG: hypothetical protein HYZ14_10065 [Bacteroidetes bacterium]|nr:hypothetical protein [Bacteroidota bacterium]